MLLKARIMRVTKIPKPIIKKRPSRTKKVLFLGTTKDSLVIGLSSTRLRTIDLSIKPTIKNMKPKNIVETRIIIALVDIVKCPNKITKYVTMLTASMHVLSGNRNPDIEIFLFIFMFKLYQ